MFRECSDVLVSHLSKCHEHSQVSASWDHVYVALTQAAPLHPHRVPPSGPTGVRSQPTGKPKAPPVLGCGCLLLFTVLRVQPSWLRHMRFPLYSTLDPRLGSEPRGLHLVFIERFASIQGAQLPSSITLGCNRGYPRMFVDLIPMRLYRLTIFLSCR